MPGTLTIDQDLTFGYTGTAPTLLDSSGIFITPSYDGEFVSVPGRNGDVFYKNNRFENIELTFRVFTENMETYRSKLNALYQKQLYHTYPFKGENYFMLEVSELPGYFRYAQFVSATALNTRPFNEGGDFELTFNCKPQLFIKSSRLYTELSQNGRITNDSGFTSKPRISLKGTGTLNIHKGTSTQGDPTYMITVTQISQYDTVIVDSVIQDCYSASLATENWNQYVELSNGFPEFALGIYTFTWTGFTKVEVAPNFWVIA